MRIDDNTETRMAEARSRKRQNKECPLLIRDDGMLYPNVPLVAKKQNFRPYRGDPKASLEERKRYLQGYGQSRRRVNYEPQDESPFELGKASAEEIIDFAMSEYGAVLDPTIPLEELRKECYRLSQLPDMDLPIATGQQQPAAAPRRPAEGDGMPATEYAAGLGMEASKATQARPRGGRRAGTAAA